MTKRKESVNSKKTYPSMWETTSLGKIGTWSGGGTPSKQKIAYWEDGTTPWVSPKDMKTNFISETQDYITDKAIQNSSAKKIPKHSLLVVTRSGILGRTLPVAINTTEVTVNQDIKAITPHFLDPKLLLFFLKSREIEILRECSKDGTTVSSIDTERLKNYKLPLPPLNEQRRIVSKIEALTERSRKAREAIADIPALLDQFRQSVLAAAFRGDLTADWRKQNPDVEPVEKLVKRISSQMVKGKSTGRTATTNIIAGRAALSVGDPQNVIPSTWKRVHLLEIARLESGHTPSRKHPEYWDGDIPWIGIKDARENHGKSIQTTHQHTNQLGLDNSAARLLPKETVCLSRTASVGYALIMGRSMATSQDFVNWVCSDALLPQFLLYAFLAEGQHLLKFGKGTTHTTIYFPEVKAFHLALPPLEEQHKIVEIVEKHLHVLDFFASHMNSFDDELSNLDQSILAKAFRGDLVPQDPNDEPASVLLDRIRAEREKLKPTKKKTTRKKSPKSAPKQTELKLDEKSK